MIKIRFKQKAVNFVARRLYELSDRNEHRWENPFASWTDLPQRCKEIWGVKARDFLWGMLDFGADVEEPTGETVRFDLPPLPEEK